MMGAAGHLALAQQILDNDGAAMAATPGGPSPERVQLAIAHALCAVAIELGVPVTPEVTEPQATP